MRILRQACNLGLYVSRSKFSVFSGPLSCHSEGPQVSGGRTRAAAVDALHSDATFMAIRTGSMTIGSKSSGERYLTAEGSAGGGYGAAAAKPGGYGGGGYGQAGQSGGYGQAPAYKATSNPIARNETAPKVHHSALSRIRGRSGTKNLDDFRSRMYRGRI
jgi:hypothetical protein